MLVIRLTFFEYSTNIGTLIFLVGALSAKMEINHCPIKHICRKVYFKTTMDSNVSFQAPLVVVRRAHPPATLIRFE